MKILMAAGEMAPFVCIGELAGAMANLSGGLHRLGHEVNVVIPFYRSLREDKATKVKKTKIRFSVPVGVSKLPCEIFEAKAPSGVRVFLVARDEYFDRSGIYGVDGRDYQDNAARFIFFTKCVLELACRMKVLPDLLHLNSWETALAPVLAHEQRLPFRTVLTPHALEFQGNFWSYDFALTNLPGDYFSARGVEYFGSMNCLKAGILFADAIVLPGERMVSAAQTPEHGCGLENVLREHQHKLTGISSAAGLEDWSPAADKSLAATYSLKKPAAREKNRTALFQALEFGEESSGPVFLVFSEACDGKNTGVLLDSLDRILDGGARLILLGPVPEERVFALEMARRKHQGSFVQLEKFDEKLARLALAGADIFLVPGRVEPRALWLRRAIRYGAIPLALQCGGLFQLVRDGDNGFVFYVPTVDGFVDACRRADGVLADKAQSAALRERCLGADFSSEATAKGHEVLYERLLGIPTRAQAA